VGGRVADGGSPLIQHRLETDLFIAFAAGQHYGD